MEIKATDLRIGNWIIDKITGSHGPVTHLHPNDNGIYDGIPLTEELLLKMGFEKIQGEIDSWEMFDFEKCRFGFSFEFIINSSYGNGYYYTAGHRAMKGEPFIYVHQLQNLYHALTGQELTLS